MNRFSAALAVAGVIGPTVASAQDTVTLRTVTAFPLQLVQNEPLRDVIDWVDANCDGLELEFVGGPEAIPTFELVEAARRGVVDVAWSSHAFYTSQMPEAGAIRLSLNTVAEQRQNGAFDYINGLHRELLNLEFLGRSFETVPFHLYLTEERDPLDLSGLTLRVAPVYRAFFTALGANVTQIPPSEIYTSLERGVVQGYGWTSVGLEGLGLVELTTHRVDPGFYVSDSNLLINLDRFQALSEGHQQCLRDAGVYLEEIEPRNTARSEEEIAAQNKAGVTPITLDEEQAAEFLRIAHESAWEELRAISPEHADALRSLVAPE